MSADHMASDIEMEEVGSLAPEKLSLKDYQGEIQQVEDEVVRLREMAEDIVPNDVLRLYALVFETFLPHAPWYWHEDRDGIPSDKHLYHSDGRVLRMRDHFNNRGNTLTLSDDESFVLSENKDPREPRQVLGFDGKVHFGPTRERPGGKNVLDICHQMCSSISLYTTQRQTVGPRARSAQGATLAVYNNGPQGNPMLDFMARKDGGTVDPEVVGKTREELMREFVEAASDFARELARRSTVADAHDEKIAQAGEIVVAARKDGVKKATRNVVTLTAG